MKEHRRLLLATLISGTVLAAFDAFAVPLPFFSSAVPGEAASRSMIHTVDADDDDVWLTGQQRHDDDGEDDDDDDDDDNERNGRSRPSPLPAGPTTPPNNGLILRGSTPKVQVN